MKNRHAQTFPSGLGGQRGGGLRPIGLVISSIVKKVERNNGRRLNVVAAGGLIASLLALDAAARLI
jgi:hypothetical protein